ncbi:MAG: hypothetical protein A2Y40_08595 [Candidatus Margulisbacteria bacterium GWF2_35_9]|nr:MAG: hypothetical protein A2Y40_08595 [Candidatus Margulisbacteria bacterium GWF2_35_9]
MKKGLTLFIACQAFFFSTLFSFFNDNLSDKELSVYRISEGHNVLLVTENIELINTRNVVYHRISLNGSDGGTAEILLIKDKMLPYQAVYYNEKKEIISKVIYREEEIEVSIPSKYIYYKYPYNNRQIWDYNTFFHLFRGYPFSKNEVILWSFYPDIKKSFQVYVKQVGEEDIFFLGKKTTAIVLESGAAGFVESILFPQIFKFWVQKDSPHLFIKFQGKNFIGVENLTELIYYKAY